MKQSNKSKTGQKRSTGALMKAPVAMTKITRQRMPQVTAKPGCTRVTHREYVGDVLGSVAFNATKYAVNAGNAQLFPWLSGMAKLFQLYRFYKLHFYYEPTVATTAAGTVMEAVDHDAADSSPLSKVAMMAIKGAVRVALWAAVELICDPKDMDKFTKQRYVRVGSPPTGTDIKTYDVGNFVLSVAGSADDTAHVGELYVSYDVELYNPSALASFSSEGDAEVGLSGSASITSEFGDYGGLEHNGAEFLNIAHTGSHFLSFAEPGEYHVQIAWTGSGFTLGFPPTQAVSGSTLDDVSPGSIFQAGTTQILSTYDVRCSLGGQYLAVDLTPNGSETISVVNVLVTQKPYYLAVN